MIHKTEIFFMEELKTTPEKHLIYLVLIIKIIFDISR